MIVKELTNGSVSGTGTLDCESETFGGLAITADGTNNAVVIIRKTNSGGVKVFEFTTKNSVVFFAPIALGTTALYYDITGTNAAAQIYEWRTHKYP